MAELYRPYDDDMAVVYWLMIDESGSDTCQLCAKWYEDMWPNRRAPRVTHYLVHIIIVKYMVESAGFDPGPPTPPSAFARPPGH
jgi:hypothetical protein